MTAEQSDELGYSRVSKKKNGKYRALLALVIVILLVLSSMGVIYALPSAGSALGRLQQQFSLNENLQNVSTDSSVNASSTSSVLATTQYVSSASNPTVFSTSLSSSNSTSQQPQGAVIDSAWVSSFISVVNAARDQKELSNLTFAQVLSQFAQTRFNTMASNYEISHYGYTSDFQQYLAGGTSLEIEELLFPAGFSPSGYTSNLQAEAPIHYNALFGSSLTKFGYYIESGPAYQVQGPCPITEIPGPNINITQYYDQYGCQYAIINSVWFVLELST